MEDENDDILEAGSVTSPVEVQQYLGGIDYPATKEDLIEYAQGMEAPEGVLAVLASIAEGEYASPAEVSEAIGDME